MRIIRPSIYSLTIILACIQNTVAETKSKTVIINEAFFTSRNHAENVDSPAVWHGPNGERWLLSTAKSTHSVLVEDATNGAFIRRLGGLGSQLGQFNRPNGIVVVGQFLFVVERDNQRVQVFALPSLAAIGHFGSDVLTNPYGIYVRRIGKVEFEAYVSDNYETADEEVPPDSQLGKRIAVYEVELEGTTEGTMDAELSRFIGETSGNGSLRIAESIHGDPKYDRLLIAEEDNEHATSGFKLYNFSGTFQDQILAKGMIHGQAEGIALVSHEDGSGFWILTDQGKQVNRFHVYDRESLEYRGAFSGNYTLNTDGVCFDPTPIEPRYPEGIFYAVHNDGNVAAFSWSEIKQALDLE